MGADLIVFIAKGPSKFKRTDIAKAAKKVQDIIDYAKKVDPIFAKVADEETLTPDEQKIWDEANDPKNKKNLLKDLLDQEQHDSLEDFGEDLSRLTNKTGVQEVNEFTSWWVSMSGRDTCGRPDPDDKKQQIVVCGDMSWGDSPDGLGYTTLTRAYWFGIPQMLGIR